MRYDVLPIVRDSPLYEGCCVYILFSYSPTMSLQLQLCSMVDWQASQRVHRSTLSDLCQKKMSDVTRTVSVLWLVVSCPVVVRGPRIDDLTCLRRCRACAEQYISKYPLIWPSSVYSSPIAHQLHQATTNSSSNLHPPCLRFILIYPRPAGMRKTSLL